MNNNQTIEKLKQMRLSAMATLHQQHVKENRQNNYTADEYLALLSEHEWEERQNKKIHRLLKQANFRQQATIAQIDYTTHRNLDKNMFMRLSTLDFMKKMKI
jgi:DNA replication protein DnaC